MNNNTLLELATELGHRLAMSGAETFRVEESIDRIFQAYDIENETFVITNFMIVSIKADTGESITKTKRIGQHGNDLDSVERYNALCRRICSERPDPDVALQWLKQADSARKNYNLLFHLLGNFLAAAGFTVFFQGALADAICAGVCGMLVCLLNRFLERNKVNMFFRTIAAAFLIAVYAYLLGHTGITHSTDAVIIGSLMLLVPGLLFVNALRDIIFGDTNSGINRIVQVVLIAAGLAIGTGAGWSLLQAVVGIPASGQLVQHPDWIYFLSSFIFGIGFLVVFNIHGPGGFLCAFGGIVCWLGYYITMQLGGDEITASLVGSAVSAIYAEIMARIRKYPAISYLVISILPLIPGAGIYYATNFLLQGDTANFLSTGIQTVGISGAMAIGILLVSSTMRFITVQQQKKK